MAVGYWLLGVEEEVGNDTPYDDEGCDDIAGRCNPSCQGVELPAQRRGVALLHLGRLEHLPALRAVADGKDTGGAVALNDGGTLHNVVAGVGGIAVEVFLYGSLRGLWLAGERRLIDEQVQRLQQFAVGGHLLAGLYDDDVAHDDVASCHLAYVIVADDLHGRVVVHLVEALESLLVAAFQEVGHPRSQQQGDDDADRLEESGETGTSPFKLVDADAYGEDEGRDENPEQRVLEASEESHHYNK